MRQAYDYWQDQPGSSRNDHLHLRHGRRREYLQRRFGKRRLSGSSLGDRQNVRDAVHEGPSGATERSREPPTSNAGREKESATRTTLNTWHVINPEGKCGQLRARSVETNPVLPTIEGCPLSPLLRKLAQRNGRGRPTETGSAGHRANQTGD